MSAWGWVKRGVAAGLTGGLSEAGGARPLVEAATGEDKLNPGQLIPKPPDLPTDTNAQVDAATQRATDVADEAHKNLQDAQNRHTDPGEVGVATAEKPVVGTAPVQPDQSVQHAGATAAPTMDQVAPTTAARVDTPASTQGIGTRIAGGTDAVTAGGQNFQVDQGGRDYENAAAQQLLATLQGRGPSVAAEQLKAAQDRAAAEQLSIAAGARGQGVAAARRNAANNISLQQVEAGGQMAQLRAQEIAQAAQGLTQAGGQLQGQALQQETERTRQAQEVELTNQKARNDAIQASRERFARGEITQAQLDADIAKANATFQEQTGLANQQTQKDLAVEKSRQQLQADLASDDRLQQSFNLEAQLKAQAAAGNQDAAVKLQGLQAQLNADVDKFNANQIQTASAQNIQNRLTALHLDDTFTAEMTQAWLSAEANHDTVALEGIKTKINAALAKASADQAWRKEIFTDISNAATLGKTASDVRVKEEIRTIPAPAVDEFLRTVAANRTWRYKPGSGRDGASHVGPMAQDVERSELGRAAVGMGPDGVKTLDYQRMAALALAGLGRVSDRLDEVEGKRRPPPDEAGFLRARRGRAA